MRARIRLAVAAVALLGLSLPAADTLEKLKAKLEREKNPADRAKITVKIGNLLYTQFAQAYAEQRYEAGSTLLDDYLNHVRRAHRDLMHSGRKASRKTKGFKELEIHLRRMMLQVNDLAQAVPYDERAPLEAALREMQDLQESLMRALFDLPRRQAADPPAQQERKP